jgi:TPR repeat protein
VELARLTALAGVSADRKEARKWYERARDLGAPDAEDRLGRLTGR